MLSADEADEWWEGGEFLPKEGWISLHAWSFEENCHEDTPGLKDMEGYAVASQVMDQ